MKILKWKDSNNMYALLTHAQDMDPKPTLKMDIQVYM